MKKSLKEKIKRYIESISDRFNKLPCGYNFLFRTFISEVPIGDEMCCSFMANNTHKFKRVYPNLNRYEDSYIYRIGDYDLYVHFFDDWLIELYYTKDLNKIGKCHSLGGVSLKCCLNSRMMNIAGRKLQRWFLRTENKESTLDYI